MRISTPATLLLGLALLAGCGSDGDDTSEPEATTSTSSTSSASTGSAPAEEPSEAPDTILVDRPAYSFQLPMGWEDITDQRVVADENTYSGRETINLVNAGTVTVDYSPEVPYDSIDDHAQSVLDAYKVRNAGIKRVEDTSWAGVPAMHAIGPGSDQGTTFQGFYMIRGDDSVQVMIQTRGGRKPAAKLARQVESTWEWRH